MLVAQVGFHWMYVGRPKAVMTYKACMKLLHSRPKDYTYARYLQTVEDLVTVHGWKKVRECCRRRAMQESRQKLRSTRPCSLFEFGDVLSALRFRRFL